MKDEMGWLEMIVGMIFLTVGFLLVWIIGAKVVGYVYDREPTTGIFLGIGVLYAFFKITDGIPPAEKFVSRFHTRDKPRGIIARNEKTTPLIKSDTNTDDEFEEAVMLFRPRPGAPLAKKLLLNPRKLSAQEMYKRIKKFFNL